MSLWVRRSLQSEGRVREVDGWRLTQCFEREARGEAAYAFAILFRFLVP